MLATGAKYPTHPARTRPDDVHIGAVIFIQKIDAAGRTARRVVIVLQTLFAAPYQPAIPAEGEAVFIIKTPQIFSAGGQTLINRIRHHITDER
jgi:hypothetical protein